MRKWPIPQRISLAQAKRLCEKYHAYQSISSVGEHWGCIIGGEVVAAFSWQPPPPGGSEKILPRFSPRGASLESDGGYPKGREGLAS